MIPQPQPQQQNSLDQKELVFQPGLMDEQKIFDKDRELFIIKLDDQKFEGWITFHSLSHSIHFKLNPFKV